MLPNEEEEMLLYVFDQITNAIIHFGSFFAMAFKLFPNTRIPYTNAQFFFDEPTIEK